MKIQLISCSACGGSISNMAKSCPHCGASTAKKNEPPPGPPPLSKRESEAVRLDTTDVDREGAVRVANPSVPTPSEAPFSPGAPVEEEVSVSRFKPRTVALFCVGLFAVASGVFFLFGTQIRRAILPHDSAGHTNGTSLDAPAVRKDPIPAQVPPTASTVLGTEMAPASDAQVPSKKPASLDGRVATCAGRSPCDVLRTWAAGSDEQGRSIEVVEIALHDKGAAGHEAAGYDEECSPFEYWLVYAEGVSEPVLLLSTCNDGYGAAGVGQDDVAVEGNRFIHTSNGGSNWRWTMRRVLELSPLRLAEESVSNWWVLGSVENTSTWNWLTMSGRTAWFVPDCGEDEQTGEDLLEEAMHHDEPMFSFEPVGQVSVPDSFRAQNWKTTSLGSCGTHVDSQGSESSSALYGAGYVIHGKPGRPSDASFEVVMASPTELYVEVRDATWVKEAVSWVKADHLEIWAGGEISLEAHCLDELPKPVQWGITLDGNVHPAAGNPREGLQVERVEVKTGGRLETVRFKINLARSYPTLTVVYSDTSDGKTQDRLIATSDLKFGNPRTLGTVHDIPEDRGLCRASGAALEFVLAKPTKSNAGEPLLD